MDPRLIVAALLAIGIGAAHSVLGERYILMRLFRRELPPLFGDDTFTRRTLRFAWHLTTVAWWGCALFILMQPEPGALRIVAAIFFVSFLLALLPSRGKHLSWVVFLAIALLCGWAASDMEPAAHGTKPFVRSWRNLPVAEANLRLDAARSAGEAWGADPTSIARHLSLGSFDETASVELSLEQHPLEHPRECRITLISNGWADDSVAGTWEELLLLREAGAGWRIDRHRIAFRCWRDEPEIYRAELCP